MYLIICGSRHYNDYEKAEIFIDRIISENFIDEEITILNGGCKGSDHLGILYANNHGLEYFTVLAQWAKYGKAAGPIRNRYLAEMGDAVICFWDGKSSGTKSMISYAERANLPIFIDRID